MKDKKEHQRTETDCLAGGICGERTSIVVRSTPLGQLDRLLAQVFDVRVSRPVHLGGDATHTDGEIPVGVELWWTWGRPVEATEFDEEQWFGWLSHVNYDLERSHALFLTDVPLEEGIQAQFGIQPNVIAVRPGASSYVLVGFSDRPSGGEALRRLRLARCLLSH